MENTEFIKHFLTAIIPLLAILLVIIVCKRTASHFFKCKHCKKEFKISMLKVIVTEHVESEYMLKCPNCKTKDWCAQIDKGDVTIDEPK